MCLFLRKISNCNLGKKSTISLCGYKLLLIHCIFGCLKFLSKFMGVFQYVRIWVMPYRVSLKGKTAVSHSFVIDALHASPFL